MLNLSTVEAKVGGSARPDCKGYVFTIISVKQTTSKSSNKPMVVFELNIGDGEFKGYFRYPLRLFQTIADQEGLSRLKGLFETILKENQTAIPPETINWQLFDEQILVGLNVGGVLKWDDKGYLDIHYLTSIEEALKKEPIPKPEAKLLDTGNENGLF